MKNETLDFTTAKGDTTAYVALPKGEQTNKTVIIIHEYWGLNDNIKDIAGRYAAEGFTAIAPDLYRGKIAENPQQAGEMMNALELEDGLDTIKNTIAAVQEKYNASHIGITGFCMGGTYALLFVKIFVKFFWRQAANENFFIVSNVLPKILHLFAELKFNRNRTRSLRLLIK